MGEIGEGDTKVAVNRERVEAEKDFDRYSDLGVGDPQEIQERLDRADGVPVETETPHPTGKQGALFHSTVSETFRLRPDGRKKPRKLNNPPGLEGDKRRELIGRLSAGQDTSDLTGGDPAAQQFVKEFARSRK